MKLIALQWQMKCVTRKQAQIIVKQSFTRGNKLVFRSGYVGFMVQELMLDEAA